MKIKKKVALSGLLLCCAITAKAQVCITPQAEQRARELVSQMTLEEKSIQRVGSTKQKS